MSESDYEVMERILPQLKLDASRPPIWEPYYPLQGSDFQNGWTCSCCGKLSFKKKESCDGCDSIMNNVKDEGCTDDVVDLDKAVIVGLQVALDVVREYRRRTGDDPVFHFSSLGLNKIANHILNLLGRESIYDEEVE